MKTYTSFLMAKASEPSGSNGAVSLQSNGVAAKALEHNDHDQEAEAAAAGAHDAACLAETEQQQVDQDPTKSKGCLAWLVDLTKQEWKLLSVGIAGMSVASAMNLVFPRIMGKAIDVASGKAPPANLSKKGFFIVVLTSFVTGSIGSFVRVYSLGMVSERIASRLRKKLYKTLLLQEFNFFAKHKVGGLTSRLTNDCQVTANAIVDIVANGYRSLNSAIGATAMLFTISPKLTFMTLGVIPLVGTGAMLFSKFSSRLAKIHQNSIASMTALAEERLNNIFTVKLFAAEDQEQEEFDKASQMILSNATRAKAARGLFMGGLSLSVNCSLFSVLYFGGSLVRTGELTIGTLTTFALYSSFVGLGWSSLSSCVGEVKRVKESSEILYNMLRTLPSCEEPQGDEELDTVKGQIRFEDVEFSYPSRKDQKVLSGLNFEINPGEVVAIVGKSGAGKTTVASLVTKIITPEAGKILLDGVDTKTLKTSWLRNQIGVVNQDPALFATTISENIMYGSPVKDQNRVIEVAKQAHVHDFIMSLPDQYDTFVGEKGLELSGGQKQRVAIARALYKNTKILLLDEATSSLDSQSEDAIRTSLDSTPQDQSVFIIAHRLNTIRYANRILHLENGKIIESGTFDELNQEGTQFYELVHSSSPIL